MEHCFLPKVGEVARKELQHIRQEKAVTGGQEAQEVEEVVLLKGAIQNLHDIIMFNPEVMAAMVHSLVAVVELIVEMAVMVARMVAVVERATEELLE